MRINILFTDKKGFLAPGIGFPRTTDLATSAFTIGLFVCFPTIFNNRSKINFFDGFLHLALNLWILYQAAI